MASGSDSFVYSLTGITLPDSVTSIGDYAFILCQGLKSANLGKGLTSIGYDAFDGCSGLTSIEIPDSVTSIEPLAFDGCSGLEHITVAAGNQTYRSEGDCLIETATKTLILGCKNSIIPNGVTEIGESAFEYCRELTSVIWNAENCTTAGSFDHPIFSGCASLKTVTFGANVKTIPAYAFYGCRGLTSITIPDSVTSIGNNAFSGTAYSNDATNWDASGVLYIDNHLIEAKGTVSGAYTIRQGTKTIARSVFSFCSGLTSIEIPDSMKSIGSKAFMHCSRLTDIQFKGTVAEWQDIEKGDEWDFHTGDYTVTCTDGTVDKQGNVT